MVNDAIFFLVRRHGSQMMASSKNACRCNRTSRFCWSSFKVVTKPIVPRLIHTCHRSRTTKGGSWWNKRGLAGHPNVYKSFVGRKKKQTKLNKIKQFQFPSFTPYEPLGSARKSWRSKYELLGSIKRRLRSLVKRLHPRPKLIDQETSRFDIVG